MAQQRLYEAEADEEVKHLEKRNSDIALYEINQEFESQRLQLQQANQWADQAQNKIRLYRDLEARNRLFREIEELRKIVAKKQIDRDKQELMNCLCIKGRNLTTVSQLLTQIQDLQNKEKMFVGCERILRS